MYNLFYNEVKINLKPLTLKQAQEQQSINLMNYGYKALIIPISN